MPAPPPPPPPPPPMPGFGGPPPPPPPMPGFGGPPPPPPPMPGFGGPPPPPPLPGGSMPTRPSKNDVPNRGALLGDISKGARLKATVTNDRSKPIIDTKVGSSSPAVPGAPSIPGLPKAPSGLAPPAPGRARSNSDTGGGSTNDSGGLAVAPQLGGLFAQGMPKLRKTPGRSLDIRKTESTYSSVSDSETTFKPPVLKPPSSSAPKPPVLPTTPAPPVPKINGLRPSPQSAGSSPASSLPSIAALKKPPPPKPVQRPSTFVSVPPKPPALPATRKSSVSTMPAAPPPPFVAPSSPAAPPPGAPPPPPPPPPPAAAPTPEPFSTPPPPPPAPPPPPSLPFQSSPSHLTNSSSSPVAMQAARNAFGTSTHSPLSQPPAPPPPPPPSSISHTSLNLTPTRTTLDPSSYILTNGSQLSTSTTGRSSLGSSTTKIEDKRWKFQDESQLPPPRQFSGVPKRYRAGRGSSVPLDFSSLS